MTTRVLSGHYGNGYTLSGAFSRLSATSSAVILGVTGTNGVYGPGAAGGDALTLPAAVTAINAGFISGGGGGAGGINDYDGGAGGAGGAGIVLKAHGVVTNTGAVYGGAAGDGGDGGHAGGAGGGGGAGVVFTASGNLTNRGVITGGRGGDGGGGPTTGARGLGGAGADLQEGGTLRNYGQILAGADGAGAGEAYTAGVVLGAPGLIVNGSATDHTARIAGGFGVLAVAAGTTVKNYGDIGAYTNWSVEFELPGRLVAEAGSYFGGAAYGSGSTLELAGGAGTIDGMGALMFVNGSINGGFYRFGAYVLDAGGDWTLTGVDKVSPGKTLTSEGTLQLDSGATLAIEDGATFQAQGAISSNGATILDSVGAITQLRVLSGGVTLFGGTVSLEGPKSRIIGAASSAQLDNMGTISGQGWIGLGKLTLVNHIGAVIGAVGKQALVVDTKGSTLTNAGLLASSGGATLVLEDTTISQGPVSGDIASSSGVVDFEDVDVIGGTISQSGAGAVRVNESGGVFDGGSTSGGPLSLSGVVQVLNGVSLTLEGTIHNAGKLDTRGVTAVTRLVVGSGGVSLTGGGQVNLNPDADNVIIGAAASDTLTNIDNRIAGAGQIGDGKMKLVNAAAGTIAGASAVTLTLNTGANTIANAGLIESLGAGLVIVKSAVDNTGTLYASTGTLTLDGLVSGAGVGRIKAGVLDVAGAFGETVTFVSGSTGIFELGDAVAFTGRVSGLSKTGANALDLADIVYHKATTLASYSGTAASGVLTVTDGTHTAHISLIGDYLGATWTLTGDGHGGVKVTDPVAPPASAPRLAAAMAAFAAAPGTASTPHAQPPPPPRLLAAGHG